MDEENRRPPGLSPWGWKGGVSSCPLTFSLRALLSSLSRRLLCSSHSLRAVLCSSESSFMASWSSVWTWANSRSCVAKTGKGFIWHLLPLSLALVQTPLPWNCGRLCRTNPLLQVCNETCRKGSSKTWLAFVGDKQITFPSQWTSKTIHVLL